VQFGIALVCLVIGVSDGDTLTARCESDAGLVNLKIRVAEIDAPEKGQAFGSRSKQHLADLCFQKRATVTTRATDRYQRTVATVACDGADVGSEQVRAGFAWVFDRYVTDRILYVVQDEARSAHRGLWADASPVAPWDWRKSKP
jgi:micrococcal nuclease